MRSIKKVPLLLGHLLLLLLLRRQCSCMATFSAPQNPPEWPKSVRVYKPNMQTADIEADAKATTSRLVDRHTGHFSSERYALLFTPGEYKNISVEVGYYVQVLGLGLNADDVRFSGGGGGVDVVIRARRAGKHAAVRIETRRAHVRQQLLEQPAGVDASLLQTRGVAIPHRQPPARRRPYG